MSDSALVYKGKVTHRSWPQLPEELVRHIATFYLWDLSANNYCPQTWDARETWHQRMVFSVLRDANEVEKYMMQICPQWHLALQTHPFWQQAIALIDPGDLLAHHAIIHPKNVSHNSSSAPAQPMRISPYRHFRNITGCSCLVCRINLPGTNAGLISAKRFAHTPYLRTIALCREHDRHPAAFCGICLRHAPVFENMVGNAAAAAAAAQVDIGVVDNDDKDTFPNVEATCRSCRTEWLWKKAGEHPGDRDAIGGLKLMSEDWETRNVVDSFIDLAEGNIKDVLMLAREKQWLRKHTRLSDMMQQALAAMRFNSGRGYEGDDQEEEEEEEDDDEDDIELMQLEENTVRDLALGDWARARILDGYWFSPADIWYRNTIPGKSPTVRAVHPCPWTRDVSSPSATAERDDDEHPRQSTVMADVPPTFTLCEQAFLVHQKQMHAILVPAMRNIVRKIVIECSTPGLGCGIEDPAIKAARMSVDDVLTELREEEGVWFEGVDWAERKVNDGREKEKRAREASGSSCTTGSDDSSTSSSSGSRSSNGTSPVLSTTTLQTTPSPPPLPLGDEKNDDASSEASVVPPSSTLPRPVTISVGPVLDPPRLIRPIPYVPVTAAHFPHYTLESIKMAWREACAELYKCRCGICERAAKKFNTGQNNAQGPPPAVVPSQVPATPQSPTDVEPELVKLEEVIDLDGEGEDEVDTLDDDRALSVEDEHDVDEVGEHDEYEELESGSGSDGDEGWYTTATVRPRSLTDANPKTSSTNVVILRPRKRSCDEIEGVGAAVDEDAHRGSTPPKRVRREEGVVDVGVYRSPVAESPRRLRKRSSEELEDVGEETVNKKIKVSSAAGPAAIGESDGDLTASSPPTSEISRPSSASLSLSDG
ncbi:hypothetical protein Hypma_012221 [Hypsizygus marmoreus]|uniref:Uncharacterized protein n=1 Tax=Hypsizygus marmoreus TaxID=39966 RepID=A0A369JPP4_HYPMA|nr:hypothetical protein Hypma_012221 [Hypsizygus marmoreus]